MPSAEVNAMVIGAATRGMSNPEVGRLHFGRMSRVTRVLGLLCIFGCSSAPAGILLYTRTAGFRHDSIPAAVEAFKMIAAEDRLAVDHTEDPAVFTSARLQGYAVVVFLHTTGEMLDAAGVQALDRYVRGGGGFLAIHAAADALYGAPTYRELVGALFLRHPAVQSGT